MALVLGVLERIRAQREALAILPGFNLERFDKLEIYARALTYAQRLHLIATQPTAELPAFQAEASMIRELLYKDAAVAVARGWIAPESLNDLKGANGYKNTASDIQILVGVLQVNAAKIQGRIGATDADRARVVDGLAGSVGVSDPKTLAHTIGRLAPRWFLVRDAHSPELGALLVHLRHTMSVLRGPLGRSELQKARQQRSSRSGSKPTLCVVRGDG